MARTNLKYLKSKSLCCGVGKGKNEQMQQLFVAYKQQKDKEGSEMETAKEEEEIESIYTWSYCNKDDVNEELKLKLSQNLGNE